MDEGGSRRRGVSAGLSHGPGCADQPGPVRDAPVRATVYAARNQSSCTRDYCERLFQRLRAGWLPLYYGLAHHRLAWDRALPEARFKGTFRATMILAIVGLGY